MWFWHAAFARLPFHQAEGCIHVHFGRVRTESDRVFTKDPFLQAFNVGFCFSEAAVQHHDELIATPATDHVDGAYS